MAIGFGMLRHVGARPQGFFSQLISIDLRGTQLVIYLTLYLFLLINRYCSISVFIINFYVLYRHIFERFPQGVEIIFRNT